MKASLFAAAAIVLAAQPSWAQERLKLAIGQINNWENQAPTLGQDAGIFKKHNLVLENFGTQGAGETVQAVISGSADIGAGVGVAGVMRAFSRGAPVRLLAPMFTGTGDIYWYVRADSPIKSLQDATDKHPIRRAARPPTTSCSPSSTTSASRRNRPRPAARPGRLPR
jgi:NitT/TauT family transport system substrate-binding protein